MKQITTDVLSKFSTMGRLVADLSYEEKKSVSKYIS